MARATGAPALPATVWDGRHNNFDALRLLLAALVLYSHCYPLGTGSEAREPFALLTRGQMTGGAVAVDLFFVMSGFMIAASAERSRGIWRFLQRRVARIYPAFAMYALLSIAVLVPLGRAVLVLPWAARIGDFFLQTLRLREFTYTAAFAHNPYPNVINGSTWSIQYECWCYVGVALLAAAGLLRRRAIALALFLASIGMSLLYLAEKWTFGGGALGVLLGLPGLWARLLPLYLAGVVFYLYRDRIPHRGWLAACSLLLLIVAAVTPLGITALFPVAGTYLVFYLAYAAWLPLQRAGRFGDFSYGLYLYAFPLQQIVMQRLGHPVRPVVLFALALPLTALAAVASWYGVERRFLRPGRRHETPVTQ